MRNNNKKDRFSWALDIIKPDGLDRILEVGCGAGMLVEKLAASLTEGKVIAMDKSPSMIRAATKRNHHFIEAGKVEFLIQDYTTASLPLYSFDKVVAFNVRAFWQRPTNYLPFLYTQLKQHGTFYLFYQPPVNNTLYLIQQANNVLVKFNYHIENVQIEPLEPAPAFCIIATVN